MLILIFIVAVIVLGIYYVTTLDFEIGSGFSERKTQAKEVEYTVLEDEKPKEIAPKTGDAID